MSPTGSSASAVAVRRLAVVAVVATAAATVDLVTKVMGSAALAGGPVELPGPLDLRLVHNRRVAFGLGARYLPG